MNSFNKIIRLILGVLLLFVVPNIYFGIKQDVLSEMVVKRETNQFLQEISTQGKLSESMWNQYNKKMGNSLNVYDIHLFHRKQVMEPEYRFQTLDEILNHQKREYEGQNEYTDIEEYPKVPYVNQGQHKTLTMNKETNESVLSNSPPTNALPTHKHTADCQIGHYHEGCKMFPVGHIHTQACGSKKFSGSYYRYYCNQCKKINTTLYYMYVPGGYSYYNDENPEKDGCRVCGSHDILVEPNKVNEFVYDCGFGADLDGDGLYDEVTKYYEYPNHSLWPDGRHYGNRIHSYDNGCYHYHQTMTSQNQLFQPNFWWTEYDSYSEDEKTYLYRNNQYRLQDTINVICEKSIYSNYSLCSVPRYYEVVARYRSMGYWDTYVCRATYELIVPQNGENKYFRFVSCNVPVADDTKSEQLIENWKNQTFTTSTIEFYTSLSKDTINKWSFPETLTLNDFYREFCPVQPSYETDYNKYVANIFFNGKRKIISVASGKEEEVIEGYYYGTIATNLYASGEIILCNDYGKDGWSLACGKEEDGHCACHEKIVSIEATHPEQSIYCGEELITTIRIIYLDGSTKVVIGNCLFDTNQVGENQTAEITYTGLNQSGDTEKFSVSIHVNVVRKEQKCTVCGQWYLLYPDGSDPGCPYCKAKIPIFTGTVLAYDKEYTLDDILLEIKKNGTYVMSTGDVIYVEIRKKTDDFTNRWLKIIGLKETTKRKILITSKIRDTSR